MNQNEKDKLIYGEGKIYIIRSNNTSDVYIGSTVLDLSKALEKHVMRFTNATEYCSSSRVLQCGEYYIELIQEFPCQFKEDLKLRQQQWVDAFSENCVNEQRAIRTKEDNLVIQKQYQIDNKERINERNRNWRIINNDKVRAREKQYRINNIDKFKAQSKERNSRPINKEKKSIYNKQYRIDNGDKINERKKQYRIDNRDKIKEQSKEYRINNIDKVKAREKEYNSKNKERKSIYNKQYRINNIEKINAREKVKVRCECGVIVAQRNLNNHKKSLRHQNYMNNNRVINPNSLTGDRSTSGRCTL